MLWAVESMGNLHKQNFLIESSDIVTRNIMMAPHKFPSVYHLVSAIIITSQAIEGWSLNHVALECNSTAVAIATSVTTGQRYQSYVAANGPAWLLHLLSTEAASQPHLVL